MQILIKTQRNVVLVEIKIVPRDLRKRRGQKDSFVSTVIIWFFKIKASPRYTDDSLVYINNFIGFILRSLKRGLDISLVLSTRLRTVINFLFF